MEAVGESTTLGSSRAGEGGARYLGFSIVQNACPNLQDGNIPFCVRLSTKSWVGETSQSDL